MIRADDDDAVAEHRPDAVLLDIAMPDMSGWEVSRRLLAGTSGRPCIIMVSANGLEPSLSGPGRVLCDDFVLKPVQQSELFAKLRLHLGA